MPFDLQLYFFVFSNFTFLFQVVRMVLLLEHLYSQYQALMKTAESSVENHVLLRYRKTPNLLEKPAWLVNTCFLHFI